MMNISNSPNILKVGKPFLRWAGGKKWALPHILNIFPVEYNNYHEPFLGGGSVFFSAYPKNKSFLSDVNKDLINTYIQVRDNINTIINILNSFSNTSEDYYKIRKTLKSDPAWRAARFIYLNKTCFNGIHRVNTKGHFNVPYGSIQNSLFFNKAELINSSKALKNSIIVSQDFYKTLSKIQTKDLVFLDPPYTVAHSNNGFLEYNKKIFSWEDQERLADFIKEIVKLKAYFILTNAKHPSILKLYKPYGTIIKFNRHSTISGIISKRKIISEYIFTNCV